MRSRHQRRIDKYGLSSESFELLFQIQRGRCACCSDDLSDDPKLTAIDHDHSTGKIRGILCIGCNTLLGRLGDSETAAEHWFSRVRKYFSEKQVISSAVVDLVSILERSNESERAIENLIGRIPTWTMRLAHRLSIQPEIDSIREGVREAIAALRAKNKTHDINVERQRLDRHLNYHPRLFRIGSLGDDAINKQKGGA